MAVFVIGWVLVLSVFFISLCGVESNITTEKNWNLLVSSLVRLYILRNERNIHLDTECEISGPRWVVLTREVLGALAQEQGRGGERKFTVQSSQL